MAGRYGGPGGTGRPWAGRGRQGPSWGVSPSRLRLCSTQTVNSERDTRKKAGSRHRQDTLTRGDGGTWAWQVLVPKTSEVKGQLVKRKVKQHVRGNCWGPGTAQLGVPPTPARSLTPSVPPCGSLSWALFLGVSASPCRSQLLGPPPTPCACRLSHAVPDSLAGLPECFYSWA